MSVVDSVLTRVPRAYRELAVRHRELIKFAVVGAVTFFIDTALFYALKLTVLEPKPVTAKVVAVLVATIVSYVLNREWSFRTRGGRERHHEAALYFVVSGVGVTLYAAPLWISRYAFHLCTPFTSRLVEEISDFTAGQIIGLLAGMAFRWWAFRKWVFPGDGEFPGYDERAEDGALGEEGELGGRHADGHVDGSGPHDSAVGPPAGGETGAGRVDAALVETHRSRSPRVRSDA